MLELSRSTCPGENPFCWCTSLGMSTKHIGEFDVLDPVESITDISDSSISQNDPDSPISSELESDRILDDVVNGLDTIYMIGLPDPSNAEFFGSPKVLYGTKPYVRPCDWSPEFFAAALGRHPCLIRYAPSIFSITSVCCLVIDISYDLLTVE